MASGGSICVSGSDNCTGSNEVYLLIGIFALIVIGAVWYQLRWHDWRGVGRRLLPSALRRKLARRVQRARHAEEKDNGR